MIVIGKALQLLSDFGIATDVRFGSKADICAIARAFMCANRTNVVMWIIANFATLEPILSERCVSRALECRRP